MSDKTHAPWATEEILRTICNAALDAVVVINGAGEFVLWNPAAEGMFGFSTEEILGQRVHNVLVPDRYREKAASGIEQFTTSGRGPAVGKVLELEALRKDGTEFPIEIVVSPVRMEDQWWASAIIRDITQRKQAEEKIREQRRDLQTIFHFAPGYIFYKDTDGRFLYVSKTMAEVTGIPQESWIGKTAFDLAPPGMAEQYYQDDMNVMASGKPKRDIARHASASGETHWVQTDKVPCRDERGQVIGMVGLSVDITEQKQAEEALRKERENLRQMLEMQDRDRKLIAYEIHDGLAQQLAGANIQLQVFEQLKDRNAQRAAKSFQQGIELLNQGIAEVRRLIGGLRPLILDDSGVAAAIQHLAHDCRAEGDPQIEFVNRAAFDRLEPTLENAIFRIVQESLTNARRHSQSDKVRIELAEQNDRIRIEVRDWGTGFDPENIREKSFGLGGIRERARLLGGRADVHSAPGEGTSIVVELPIVGDYGGDAPPQM